MKVPTNLIQRSFISGVMCATMGIAFSLSLYSLSKGRELMETPFNLIATVVQMPGLVVATWLEDKFANYSIWLHWGATFCVQSFLWSGVSALIYWIRGRTKHNTT